VRRKHKQFDLSSDFAVFHPTGDDLALALNRSIAMGVLPHSVTKGLGRMTGCLGEIAVQKFLSRSRYVGDEVFTHDLIFKKKRVEVKSKTCSSEPKMHYTASVNAGKKFRPNNDAYYFTRVRKDLMCVWVVGWLPTTQLLKKATYRERGYKDSDGFLYRMSGLHIPIDKLNRPSQSI